MIKRVLPIIKTEINFVLSYVFYEQSKETLYMIDENKLMLILYQH